MKLYRRKDDKGAETGPYWYRFVYKGRRVRRSSGIHNKDDAKDIASAYRTQLAKGEVGIEEPEEVEPVPKFSQAMKDFLEWSESEYAAHPNTHRRYAVSSKALLRHFGNVALDRITSNDVEKFKTTRAKQKKAAQGKKSRKAHKATKQLRPGTVNRELACLKHLFTRNEVAVLKNPVKGVKFLEEDNEQSRVLNAEEEKLYLLAASQPLQDIATIMIETGMRPEEVYRIRRENAHIEQGYVLVPFGKTKAARRKVPLSDTALTVLLKRLNKEKGTFLFPGRSTEAPIVKVNAAHTATVKRCKVETFRLYDLRHTWATRMAMAGVDLVTLAAMLGHSRIQMVLRYAHPTEEHQFAAMEKRQRYMAK
ncbi:site-specific integrase [soil metagenome]